MTNTFDSTNPDALTHLPPLRVCVDRRLDAPPAQELPDDTSPESSARFRLAADLRKLWPGEWRVLAVRFLDGNPQLHQRIAAVAAEWSQFANIRFVFNDAQSAPIRISLTPGPSWSLIGTDALDERLGPDDPTMNFGWLTRATAQDELRRVVLHEFGHALGLIHEHQSPQAEIPWDKETVYRYYAGPPNYWTPAEVDQNVFTRYQATLTNASHFDPHSIMLYPIPPEFTRGKLVVGWNRDLSPLDRSHIGRVYPFPPEHDPSESHN